jgi:broad specificity phosphatase PhoE
MDFYLIRHADTNSQGAPDPYSVPLNERGQQQARALGERSRQWALQMLCVSTTRRNMDTADPISAALPDLVRWDLEELEDLSLDDLNYEPGASHLVATWTEDQQERGLISLWGRLTAACVRIQVYAQTYGLERIGIVASERVLNLMIAYWLGQDWRLWQQGRLSFAESPVCRVTLAEGEPALIAWLGEQER